MRLIGWVASVRISSSPGDPLAGDGRGVRAFLHTEGLARLGRAGERVEPGDRPVVEHGLEGLADERRVEVLDVVELGLAVGVVVAAGEEVDVAVVVHSADHAVEVDGAVEEVPRHVALEGPEEGVDRHDVAAGRPGDVGEELVAAEVEAAEGELLVALGVRPGGLHLCGLGDGHLSSSSCLRTGRSRPSARRCRPLRSSAGG
jgi:hypothetical protein